MIKNFLRVSKKGIKIINFVVFLLLVNCQEEALAYDGDRSLLDKA
jgi:hypothetical protein